MNTVKKIRRQIYDHCISLGMPIEISKKISVNATDINDGSNYILPIEFMVTSLFSWDDSPEGEDYWIEIYDRLMGCGFVEAPSQKPTLSHTEIQTLISILKVAVQDVSSDKGMYGMAAANTWDSCIKGTEEGQTSFKDFSYFKSRQEYCKQKEKKLGKLLNKLKGMR